MLEDKVINFVSLILETCERIHIDREHINDLNISGIKERWRLYTPNNSLVEAETITKDYTCDKFHIEIKKKANDPKDLHNFVKGNVVLPFDRLKKYKDITGIMISYMDGEDEYVHVPWGGKNGNEDAEENDFQVVNDFVDEFNDATGISVTIEAPTSWRSKY